MEREMAEIGITGTIATGGAPVHTDAGAALPSTDAEALALIGAGATALTKNLQ